MALAGATAATLCVIIYGLYKRECVLRRFDFAVGTNTKGEGGRRAGWDAVPAGDGERDFVRLASHSISHLQSVRRIGGRDGNEGQEEATCETQLTNDVIIAIESQDAFGERRQVKWRRRARGGRAGGPGRRRRRRFGQRRRRESDGIAGTLSQRFFDDDGRHGPQRPRFSFSLGK